MPEISFSVTPIGKPRMTARDKWKKRPVVERWFAFKDAIKAAARQAGFQPIDHLHIIAYIPMPQSWSKKKKAAMLGTRHKQKPDWDNIGKAVCDALYNRTKEDDDSGIWDGRVSKFWAEEGKIIIRWQE